ncbi:putative T6SS immunity periplasmic lipoprotein [Yersinia aldovae]|uniref:putative T6SS immunity periplasmic lipoprotein n=1 Tax=Yersinia aldovae TaxID=29483 RepID=UPI0011A4D564|nr:putative T6SS immunity periplasmic lipoprotein [Yersinia aldovae]
MRNAIIFSTVLLVTSCHTGDHRPLNYRSSVTTVANNVCITVPTSDDEYIYSLSISEVGNYSNRTERIFTVENPPKLQSNKCAPNFGFNFETGKSYISSISSQYRNGKDKEPNRKNYSVTFSLWKENGQLKAVDIN